MAPLYVHISELQAPSTKVGLWTQYTGVNSGPRVDVVPAGFLNYADPANPFNEFNVNGAQLSGIGLENTTVATRCAVSFRKHFITFGGGGFNGVQRLDIQPIITSFTSFVNGNSNFAEETTYTAFVPRSGSNSTFNAFTFYQERSLVSPQTSPMNLDINEVTLTPNIVQSNSPQRLGLIRGKNFRPAKLGNLTHVITGDNTLVITNGERFGNAASEEIFMIIPNANSIAPTFDLTTINWDSVAGSVGNTFGIDTTQNSRSVGMLDNPNITQFQDGSPTPPSGNVSNVWTCGLTAAPNANQCAIMQAAINSNAATNPFAVDRVQLTLNLINIEPVTGQNYKEGVALSGIDLTQYYPNISDSNFWQKPCIVYLDEIERWVIFGSGAGTTGGQNQTQRLLLLSCDPLTGEFTVEDNILIPPTTDLGNIVPSILNLDGHIQNFALSIFGMFDPFEDNPNRLIENNQCREGIAANQDALSNSGEAIFLMVPAGAEDENPNQSFNSQSHFFPFDTSPPNSFFATEFYGTGLFAVRVENDQFTESTANIINCDPLVNQQEIGFWFDRAFYAGGAEESIYAFNKKGGTPNAFGGNLNRELELEAVRIKL